MPNCRKSLHHRPFHTSLPTTCPGAQEADKEPWRLSPGSSIGRSHYGPALSSNLRLHLRVHLSARPVPHTCHLQQTVPKSRPGREQQALPIHTEVAKLSLKLFRGYPGQIYCRVKVKKKRNQAEKVCYRYFSYWDRCARVGVNIHNWEAGT